MICALSLFLRLSLRECCLNKSLSKECLSQWYPEHALKECKFACRTKRKSFHVFDGISIENGVCTGLPIEVTADFDVSVSVTECTPQVATGVE